MIILEPVECVNVENAVLAVKGGSLETPMELNLVMENHAVS